MARTVPEVGEFPLGKATKVRCEDVKLAERTVGSLIEPRRLRILGKRQEANIRISHIRLNHSQLFGVRHGVALHASSDPISSYQVMVPLRGELTTRTRCGEIVASPGGALVYSPGDRLNTGWSAGCVALVLSVPNEQFKSFARAAGMPLDKDLSRLDPLMRLDRGSGSSFANALSFICRESVDEYSALGRGLTTRAAEEMLLLSFLFAQRSDTADAAPHPSGKRSCYVEAVLDFMHANHDKNLGMEDFVRIAGVSARTLQYGFIEQTGIGPMTYWKQLRLHHVRAALLADSDSARSIGNIAARWGFYNGSVFAKAYRKMFGELPSATGVRH